MRHRSRATSFAAVAALLLAGACEREAPLNAAAPEGPSPTHKQFELACVAHVDEASVRCGVPVQGGGNQALVFGGQGQFVQLTSSNITVAADTFAFDVTVQNLIPQPLATQDGTTPHPDGVRVFFRNGPTATAGSGEIRVANPDGLATYTAADQPYFQYDGILATNATSAPRRWRLEFDPGVESFVFGVMIAAEVQYPERYIDFGVYPEYIVEGEADSLIALVRDALGRVVEAPVEWSSSTPEVATITANGALTAVAPGVATIQATSGVATAELNVAVCPALEVGEVYTARGTDAARLCFSGGSGGNEYTLIAQNFAAGSSLSLSSTGTGIMAVSGPPTPSLSPAPAMSALGAGVSAGDESYDHVVARELELRAVRGLAASPSSLVRSPSPSAGPSFNVVPGVPSVGDLWTLNVAQACSGARDDRVGRVVRVSQHLIIVADTANPPGGFTTAQYDSIGLEFDTIVAPTVYGNFGEPYDVDGNERVVAFYTRAVNELSPPASSAVTYGLFSVRDLFSSASCERSNEGEVLYMLVPDPTGAVNSNVRTVSLVRGNTISRLGHELQHLVNATRRLYVNGAPLEEAWLDEGLSDIAEELLFYRISVGLAPEQNVNLAALTQGPNASRRVAAFNTFANPNFGRLRSWLQRPDTTGAFRNVDNLATRGARWAFLRYAADRASDDQTTFWSGLVDADETGLANLQQALGEDPADWLRDFTMAMYADDAVAGATATYSQPSWNFRSVFGGLGGYPLVPRPLVNGVSLTLSYSRGGGSAFQRFRVPADGFANFTHLSGGSLPPETFGITVMRTR